MRSPNVLLIVACALMAQPANAQPDASSASSVSALEPVAKVYLDQAIAMFRKSHINGAKADWPTVTAKAYAAAAGAKRESDTYPAIQLIIKELGEKHTQFLDPDTATAETTGVATGAAAAPILALAEVDRFADGIGVVRLYGFAGSDELAKHYAEYGRSRIAGLRAKGVCRFILDLRNNTGGNMYPMLTAVSPLLDDGILGSFDYADGRKTYWGLRGGQGIESADAIPSSEARNAERFPVAVLIGPRTASSGEFTAMSFKGRANTRFFGMPTAGYVTVNDPFKLSDGAMIIMTDAWASDRTGKKYVDVVQPDEAQGYGGPTIDAAKEWLLRQPCPSGRQSEREH